VAGGGTWESGLSGRKEDPKQTGVLLQEGENLKKEEEKREKSLLVDGKVAGLRSQPPVGSAQALRDEKTFARKEADGRTAQENVGSGTSPAQQTVRVEHAGETRHHGAKLQGREGSRKGQKKRGERRPKRGTRPRWSS